MFKDYPEILEVKDICTILHIGKNTAYHLLQSGIVPYRKIGRKYIVTKKELIAYLNKTNG